MSTPTERVELVIGHLDAALGELRDVDPRTARDAAWAETVRSLIGARRAARLLRAYCDVRPERLPG